VCAELTENRAEHLPAAHGADAFIAVGCP
jgi:hypothetical protein